MGLPPIDSPLLVTVLNLWTFRAFFWFLDLQFLLVDLTLTKDNVKSMGYTDVKWRHLPRVISFTAPKRLLQIVARHSGDCCELLLVSAPRRYIG